MKSKNRLFFIIIFSILFIFSLTACGPSEEKIAQAQQKYTELAQAHNTVVEAHKEISDDSLDASLTELKNKIAVVEGYNLQEMKDEEIDLLIQTMDALIASYGEYHAAILDIKAKEDAKVLTPIPVTIVNNTEFSFSGLYLYEKGNQNGRGNALEDASVFAPTQTITGLLIQRNVKNTVWVLSLVNAEGQEFEISLPVKSYTEDGVTLKLCYNEEDAKLTAENA